MLSVKWRHLPAFDTILRLRSDPSTQDAHGGDSRGFPDLELDPNDPFLDIFNVLGFATVFAV